MRISDWSSDVCSSDLRAERRPRRTRPKLLRTGRANAMSSVRERGRQLEFDHEENGPSCDQRSRLARRLRTRAHILDRKSVVEGTGLAVRVELGGRRIIKKTTTT